MSLGGMSFGCVYTLAILMYTLLQINVYDLNEAKENEDRFVIFSRTFIEESNKTFCLFQLRTS